MMERRFLFRCLVQSLREEAMCLRQDFEERMEAAEVEFASTENAGSFLEDTDVDCSLSEAASDETMQAEDASGASAPASGEGWRSATRCESEDTVWTFLYSAASMAQGCWCRGVPGWWSFRRTSGSSGQAGCGEAWMRSR